MIILRFAVILFWHRLMRHRHALHGRCPPPLGVDFQIETLDLYTVMVDCFIYHMILLQITCSSSAVAYL